MRGFDTWCRIVAAWPARIGCTVVSASLLISGLPFAIWGPYAMIIDTSLNAFAARGNTIARRHYAVNANCGGCRWRRLLGKDVEDSDRRLGESNGSEPLASPLFYGSSNLVVVYSSKNGENVLTDSGLQQALSLEREVTRLLGNPPTYSPLHSIFPNYPSSAGVSGSALEARLTHIAEMIRDSRYREPGLWPQFDKGFSSCNLASTLLSSGFYVYSVEGSVAGLADLESEDMRVAFFPLHSSYFRDQRDDIMINRDMMLLIGSVLGCLALMWIMTSSFFIASMGLLGIILSTGLAVCIYRFFVSPWLGVLNMFAFFLLLGIGCDDVFVLVDTWDQATRLRGIPADDYVGRLRFTLPRSGGSICTTSLTTAVAFFGNAISVIPPMKLFGIFSGIMVLLDFILTMCFLPSMLVLQHRMFGGLGWGSRCRCKAPNSAEDSNVSDARSNKGAMDRFLICFAPKVLRFAPVFVLMGCVLLGVSLNVALELPPGEEFHNSELFPWWHNQPRAYAAQQSMRDLHPDMVFVGLIYGIVPEDTGDILNPASDSEIIWDTNFNPLDPRVQQFAFDLCSALVAERSLVKSLHRCWAQDLYHAAVQAGTGFPVTDLHSVRYPPYDEDAPPAIWADISVESTTLHSAPIKELKQHWERWEAFMDKWNEEAERRGIGASARGFQHAHQWQVMATISDLMTSCIAACCISTASVAVMLTITLGNTVLVSLAVLHVIGISLGLVATFVMEGRVLGVLESIASSLLIGLSVDFLAHVSSAYLAQPADNPRGQKTVATIRHLGGAVIAGALTTIVSAVFLCFALIAFFSTFGWFIIRMIAFSLVATLLSYVSALSLFGPEGSWGQIPCPRRCKAQVADAPEEALVDEIVIPVASKRARKGTCIGVWVILVAASIVCIVRRLRTTDEKPVCPDYTELEFVFEDNPISSEMDSYRCRGGFNNIPRGCVYYATECEPIIGNQMVHHALLFDVLTESDSCPFTCFDMPNLVGVQMAWAIGAGALKWPAGTAQAIGHSPLVLQMHYYNPLLKQNAVDPRSGLRFKVSQQPPEHLLVSLMIGLHPEGRLYIPPNETNITFHAECTPSLIDNVTVVAFATHAHKLGRRIMTQVTRTPLGAAEATVVGDVGNTPEYHFDFQRFERFPLGEERRLSPGDGVRVRCTYDSTDRSEVTSSGWGSDEEMCMTFLVVHPGENVINNNCLVYSAFEEDSW